MRSLIFHGISLLPTSKRNLLLRPRFDIRNRSQRCYGRWVDMRMALAIILLDMLEISRLLEAWQVPVQIPQIPMVIRIVVSNGAYVQLKVLHINGVEADQSRIGFQVHFADVVAENEWEVVAFEDGFELV